MAPSVTLLSSALGKGEANKQRRKVQNRKNQRAHRESFPTASASRPAEIINSAGLRMREQDPASVQTSRPFQVRRWRVDEPDDFPSPDASTSISRPHPHPHAHTPLTPPAFVFPLSTDHLLHLVQYNVFRAFVSNKRTLNAFFTGPAKSPPSPTICPISGPYRDDTTVYPLNPNIPPTLVPTRLQQTRVHSFWINLFPSPSVRDNLIRHDGSFDHRELLQDLIGELMSATPARKQRGPPRTITVSEPTPKTKHDEDEVTAGRKGLIVWGEPYDMRSWEATPGFLAKWAWAVEGCHDLIASSNRWRRMRGEEPLRLPEQITA